MEGLVILNKKRIKEVLHLALPAVGEMILYMMIWVFDTMMVGQYGGQVAVSTVGLSSEILYTLLNIFIAYGVSVGTVSLISRRLGGNEKDFAEEYATLGLLLGGILSLILFLITFFASPIILKYAGAKSDVLKYGIMYMKIVSIGMFFHMLMNVLNSILRGGKNTKTPLLASVIINIINLFLDWVLIFGKLGFPEWGIRGAAIATAIAHISGFVFIATYVAKHSQIKPRLKYVNNFSFKRCKELIKLSMPSSFQEAAFSVIKLLGSVMIMNLGELSFAANQITTTIESVSFMPGNGFAVATTTLVGHKVGEKKYKEAKEYVKTSTTLGVLLMTLCGVMFLIFPKFLMSLFINKSEVDVISLGATCLMIAAVEQPFMGIHMILTGAFNGAGDTKTPFIISFISNWLIRLPLMIYFIHILKVSVIWVWWITGVQWIVQGVVMYIIYRRKFNFKMLG